MTAKKNSKSQPATSAKNSTPRTLAFAVAIALFCGALVTAVSVLLAPVQSKNRQQEQQQLLESLMLSQPGFESIASQHASFSLTHRLVDLDTGCYNDQLDVTDFADGADHSQAQAQTQLTPAQDIANIGSRADHVLVHLVHDDSALVAIVLPVYGLGYQSKLRGYLTLKADGNTIRSLVFFDHKETPGMGGRISNSAWQKQWQEKKLRDPQGLLRIQVATNAPTHQKDHDYAIDAMSGASITGRGITNLLRFWAGPLGFETYLANLKSGMPCVSSEQR